VKQMPLYKKILAKEAEGIPVQFVGVYLLKWRQEWGEPSDCFVEDNTLEEVARRLLIVRDLIGDFRIVAAVNELKDILDGINKSLKGGD